MGTIFDDMRLTRVFIQKGNFSTNKRDGRLLQAPFDLVVIPGLSNEQFLQPRTQFNAITGVTLNIGTFTDEKDEAIYMDGEGYTTPDAVILDGDYAMGCFQSTAENWKDVHRFAWI
jgi:hypothetical protein